MSAVSWKESLELAATEQDVVRLARDFVASLEPADIARLPQVCRPGKFFDAVDITAFAFDVVRYECADHEPLSQLVHRIAAFFSQAATRLSQIMASSNDPLEEEARSA